MSVSGKKADLSDPRGRAVRTIMRGLAALFAQEAPVRETERGDFAVGLPDGFLQFIEHVRSPQDALTYIAYNHSGDLISQAQSRRPSLERQNARCRIQQGLRLLFEQSAVLVASDEKRVHVQDCAARFTERGEWSVSLADAAGRETHEIWDNAGDMEDIQKRLIDHAVQVVMERAAIAP